MKAAMLTIAAAAAAIACQATSNDILDNPFVLSLVPPLPAPKD